MSHTRPRWIVGLVVMLSALWGTPASAQAPRLPFEYVMRDVQARYEFATGNSYTWPPCCYGGGGSPPAYPPDGFYGDHIGRVCGKKLTESIVSALCTATPTFLKENCWDLEGKSYSAAYSYLTAADLGFYSGLSVTVNNYGMLFSLAQTGVKRLSHVKEDTTQVDGRAKSGEGRVTVADAITNCVTALNTAYDPRAIADWTAASWYSPYEGPIGKYECAGAITPVYPNTFWQTAVIIANNDGKVRIDLTGMSSRVSGTGVVYFATNFVGLRPSNDPPVETDQKWHSYFSSSVGYVSTSEALAGPDHTEATLTCSEATCTGGPGDTWDPCACSQAGWVLLASVGVVELTFDTSGTSATPCSSNIKLPPWELTSGSLSGGDHGDSGGNGTGASCGKGGGAGGAGGGGGGGAGGGPGAGRTIASNPGGHSGSGSPGSGKNPEWYAPVELETGAKVERDLDLTVALPGTEFRVYRGYCSNPALSDGNGICGARWSMSIFTRLQVGTTDIDLVGMTLKENLRFAPVSTGVWSAGGAGIQKLESTTTTINSVSINVYRLSEPGQWYMDFYRDAGPTQGLLLQEVDVYGNKQTYKYELYGDITDTSNVRQTPRLVAVYLGGEDADDAIAEVLLDWNLPELPETTPVVPLSTLGKLHAIASYRFDSSRAPILLKQVTYLYKEADDGLSADLGIAGDLIQVTSSERVDLSPELPFHMMVTQYRYHGNTPHTTGGERLTVTGGDHQLKHLIRPEQIQFVAQLIHAEDTSLAPGAVTSCATDLLSLDDDATISGASIALIELPSKIVGYSSQQVTVQYLQTACGCSGGSQGLKEEFSYWTSSSNASTTVTESIWSTTASAYVAYRKHYNDMKLYSGVAYMITYGLEDATDSSKRWVWHYVYDSNLNLVKAMLPSAKSSYTPSSGAAASYTASSSAGVVYGWAYNTDNRLTESRIAEGNIATDPAITGFTLLSKTTYPGTPGTSERKWLPTKIELYRTATSTADDDVELTTFTYGFHSGDKIAWVKTTGEAETVAENGPGGSYDSVELFDSQGQNIWSCSPDLTLTKREFGASTGSITSVTRNASNSGLSSPYAGLTTTSWGPAASSDGSLTTTYTHDLLGRVTSRTAPGGVTSYTLRVLQEDPDTERKRVSYFAQVSLPHQLNGTSTFDGPASVTWINDGGQSVRSSDYTIDGSAAYAPLSLTYTFSAEIAKSSTQHHLSGLVQSRKDWQDVTGTRTPAYSTTSYTYDAMGRIDTITSPTLTITQNSSYDVQGRVLEVKVGTNAGTSGNDMVVVGSYFYDSGGAASQGVGDGHLTLTRQHTGETGTGALGYEYKKTKRYFDPRGRLAVIERDLPPHEFLDYDNLGRVARRALYSTVPVIGTTNIGASTDSNRGLYSQSKYSQRGLLYKQRIAIDPGDISGTSNANGFLESNYWFDSEGRTIAEWSPNSPATKRVLDAQGRTKTLYVTDRAGDAAPGESGTYASVTGSGMLTDDNVIEQTQYTYGGSDGPWPDRLALVKTMRRHHDSGATGALTSSSAVVTYLGYYYDTALRRTYTVDFGTNTTSTEGDIFKNAASAPTWPPSALALPTFGTQPIVSAVEYNARGLVARSIDPKEHKTEYRFDDLSRRIAVIENAQGTTGSLSIGWNGTSEQWTVSGLSSTARDQNRVTSFVYDEAGNVVKQIAHTSDTTSQVTKYNYGTTMSTSVSTDTDSLVGTKSLLREVIYPDESSGQPGSGGTYKVAYAYNQLGELRSVVDQNNTKHTYTRDILGRVLTDTPAVPGSGSNIDTTIKRIGVGYDDFGRLATVRSYDNLSTGNVRNAVEFLYRPLWQVGYVFQNASGDIARSGTTPSGSTVVVQYSYVNIAAPTSGSEGNYSRLNTMTYPTGNYIGFEYGGGSDMDDHASRVTSIGMSGDDLPIVVYSRLGLDMFAVVDYPLSDVQLDRTFSQNGKRRIWGAQAAGLYPGWDRHGRVAIQAWVDGDLSTMTSPHLGNPTRPAIVDEVYTYDAASNRVSKDDMRPGVKWASPDSRYSYDGLNRLREDQKDTHTAGTFGTKKGSQRWTLDVLGNWETLEKELGTTNPYGDTGEVETRLFNEANEITNRYPNGSTTSTPDLPFVYDHAGNLRDQKLSSTTSDQFTHDAWNRLVKHIYTFTGISGTTDTIEYEYNGLHWRTIKKITPAEGSSESEEGGGGTGGTLRTMYYSAAWQLIEERIDDDVTTSPSETRREQEIWGIRYIDDPVMRTSVDPNGDADPNRYYHLTDVQFSTVAMIGMGADPEVVERVRYDAYGKATHRWGCDITDDGQVNSSDSSALSAVVSSGYHLYDSGYDVAMDLNRDGVINSTDSGILSAAGTIAALADGEISDRSTNGPDNVFGYDGYVFAPEIQRYCVRYRWYDPPTGRWMERDPIEYGDGANLFQYGAGDPVDMIDPSGLVTTDERLSWRADRAALLGPGPCTAGPCTITDVTAKLTAFMALNQKQYLAATPALQRSFCSGLVGVVNLLKSFDIWQFYEGGGSGGAVTRSQNFPGDIAMFHGQCYKLTELNYILWGQAKWLCGQRRFTTIMFPAFYRLVAGPLGFERMGIEGRAQWSDFGYSYGPSQYANLPKGLYPTGTPCPKGCAVKPYQGKLNGYWGGPEKGLWTTIPADKTK